MFNPGLKIGEDINNARLMDIFKCSQQGGMRRSHATNTLVIVSDYTKGIYHDKWIARVLHYTGMGLAGDQDINYAQNRTLNESKYNGIDVHLFEVMDPGVYTYCGRVHLVDEPYTEIQTDVDGNKRKVWMFPIQPIPDNDVKKPMMFVFKDMLDYRTRGANVEQEYADYLASLGIKRASQRKQTKVSTGVAGRKIIHKKYGEGLITKYSEGTITVKFSKETKTLNYELCTKNGIIEFV